jgi:hypothetical protein
MRKREGLIADCLVELKHRALNAWSPEFMRPGTLTTSESRLRLIVLALLLWAVTMQGTQSPALSKTDPAARSEQPPKIGDGQHDFDFNIGVWHTTGSKG